MANGMVNRSGSGKSILIQRDSDKLDGSRTWAEHKKHRMEFAKERERFRRRMQASG